MSMLNAVLAINESQPGQITALLRRKWGALRSRRVLVLGLAFKPGTDDVRESASRKLIADLLGDGAEVVAHDPVAEPNARLAWPELAPRYADEWVSELDDADAVVVATTWPDYRRLLEPANLARLCGKVLVDARRFFRPAEFAASTYLTIGFSHRI
jgi:UDPglucose 6-dehydrogenase/GDP-mannose 6-dehydrogenase